MPTPSPSLLPPAQPKYIFRGHASQIHALAFSPDNSTLLTADADGWVVHWQLATRRPRAAWKAHDSAVLGVAWWGGDAVITHGRDSRLVVWRLGGEAEQDLSRILPLEYDGGGRGSEAEGNGDGDGEEEGDDDEEKDQDGKAKANDQQQSEESQVKPEVLHELTLNTLNFCAFAWCWWDGEGERDESTRRPILLAVPHTLDSEAIDIFHLPSTNRLSTLPALSNPKTGMAMALAISRPAAHFSKDTTTLVAAGYESGHAAVFANVNNSASPSAAERGSGSSGPGLFTGPWQRLYTSNPHSQPILSLSAAPDSSYFITSSADDVLAKHPFLLPPLPSDDPQKQPLKITHTKHAGQQGLSVRSDGLVFATAGWDGRVRVYSTRKMKEVAVLKWHKEGCYATAMARVEGSGGGNRNDLEKGQGNGEEAEARAGAEAEAEAEAEIEADVDKEGAEPTSTNTATTRSVAEEQEATISLTTSKHKITTISSTTTTTASHPNAIDRSEFKFETVAARRERKVRATHWLAAGCKDGRVSLWDVC